MSGTGDLHYDFALDEWRAGRRPHPRPAKRQRDPEAGRAKAGECRLCGRRVPQVGHIDRHHLVPRSQSGDDVEANLVGLCAPWEPSCHRLITANDRVALMRLRAALWPEEVAYVVEKKGQAWLDARYPDASLD